MAKLLSLPEGVKATGMHIRSRAYLQVISRLRALRLLLSPPDNPAAQETSPLLIYIAIVLACLWAMLEADLHSVELQALGLGGGPFPGNPSFVGP
jgi:hypothetical protein